ncbi:ABC transporter ATP-binding protein [Clostridia bacterium]|nr:ABC transporter ATP-binding protein [Clostridia bacterium]
MIRLSNVVKEYRAPDSRKMIQALKIDSLTIGVGEKVGVCGMSGSGKTTLLHVLSGIVKPSSGEVEVNGIRLDRLSEPKRDLFRARNVGYIFQFFYLIPYLSALDNVTAAMFFGGGQPRGEMERKALQLLESVGLAERARHLPGQLSGGEQQRVCIARALANDPPLIIADEPTANLDLTNKSIVLDMLHRACDDKQLTLLLASHDRDTLDGFERRINLDDMMVSNAA